MFSPIRLTPPLLQCSPHLVSEGLQPRAGALTALGNQDGGLCICIVHKQALEHAASSWTCSRHFEPALGPAVGKEVQAWRCRHEAQVGRKIWYAAHMS